MALARCSARQVGNDPPTAERAAPVAAEPRMGPGLPKLQVGTAGWRWLGLYLASIGGLWGHPPRNSRRCRRGPGRREPLGPSEPVARRYALQGATPQSGSFSHPTKRLASHIQQSGSFSHSAKRPVFTSHKAARFHIPQSGSLPTSRYADFIIERASNSVTVVSPSDVN